MALLKAAALGTIAAFGVPFVLRGEAGLLGQLAHSGTFHPPVGTFGFAISGPIFLGVTAFGWLLLKAAGRAV